MKLMISLLPAIDCTTIHNNTAQQQKVILA